MVAKRQDHFGREVPAPEPTRSFAKVQAEEGKPPVSSWLIEHLEATFGGLVPDGHPTSMDDLVALSSRHSEAVGQRSVIDYLKRLLDEQLHPTVRP